MTITVYDWNNVPKFIDIPAESIDEIEYIYVHVITGDETGYVQLKNGKAIEFDASDNRLVNYYRQVPRYTWNSLTFNRILRTRRIYRDRFTARY